MVDFHKSLDIDVEEKHLRNLCIQKKALNFASNLTMPCHWGEKL